MKKNRMVLGVLICILIMLAIWSLTLSGSNEVEQERYTVSVIVNDSNNDRWFAMREGLEQAAQDYHFQVNYGSTGEITSLEEELLLIRRELERGVDGLIIQMVDASISPEQMSQITNQAPVVLIETDVIPEELHTYVGPDNWEMGYSLASEIESKVSLTGKTIGILAGDQKQFAMQKRLEGCMRVLEGTQAHILWTIEEETDAAQAELAAKLSADPVDILIMLGNDETEQAIDYFLSVGDTTDCLLYGIGRSEKAVYYLDKGLIQSLVVPNEFNMGYQSIAAMAKQINRTDVRIERYPVDFLIVNRENLYERDNQKVLFPIVQ